MNKMIYFDQIKSGMTVSFVYLAGSNPGATRTVKVDSTDNESLCGVDQDKEEMRRFNFDRISGSQVCWLVPVKTQAVYFTDARRILIQFVENATGEMLADLYGKVFGKANPRFMASTGTVEYDVPEMTYNVDGKVYTASELRQLLDENS